jgi:anthranilate phosphoribosyltransferase
MTGDRSDLKSLLAHVAQGHSLSESEAEAAFDIIMSGNATASQMGAFLMALRVRGAAGHDRYLRHRRGCLGQL